MITPVERRSVEEWSALFELEPTIQDVFVEGTSDRVLIEWYLGARVSQKVTVWEIDCVDIPGEMVANHKLEIGNRGRAITFAYELTKYLGSAAVTSVAIIVDADADRSFIRDSDCAILMITDYACVEMYLFNEPVFNKFLTIVTMGCTCSAPVVLRELARILQKLFLVRLANQALAWNMKWMSCERTCTLKGNTIVFDEEEFIHRYLTRNGRRKHLTEFARKISEESKRLLPDPRHQMNGHDFISVLRWMIRPMVGDKKVLANARAFERSLFACLELATLSITNQIDRFMYHMN